MYVVNKKLHKYTIPINGAVIYGMFRHEAVLRAEFCIWAVDLGLSDREAVAILVANTERYSSFFKSNEEALQIARKAIKKLPKFKTKKFFSKN